MYTANSGIQPVPGTPGFIPSGCCSSSSETSSIQSSSSQAPCTATTAQGTLSGQCPGSSFPCTFTISGNMSNANISCSAFSVSLHWNGTVWSVTSAPCGPHTVTNSSFTCSNNVVTMHADMRDNGCNCNWTVSVP